LTKQRESYLHDVQIKTKYHLSLKGIYKIKTIIHSRIGGWLLFNANSPIVQLYHGEQVNLQWDDDEVRFVIDQHDEFDFYSARSLKQQSADVQVVPLRHINIIILISSQPVFVLSP